MGDTLRPDPEGQEMPWGAMSTQALREEFVRLSAFDGSNIRELCRRFGISPKTGYKWLSRARAGGEAWAADRSRRPDASPWRCSPAIEAAVVAVRAAHPAWGGRKIATVLAREGLAAPAPSTVTAILRRHGMAVGAAGGGVPFRRFEQAAANDLWQMDFKGHVGLGDGMRLHPLSVLDDHSRYAVVLAACPDERTGTVREALIGAFRRYGLPRAVITDNGPPWGDGPGHPFTPLGVFLIEQGIRIAHARPYHPQTLGKDERFHRSLKAEVLSGPPFASLAAARALERWRHVYNRKRPHEGIGLSVPADRYTASPRAFCEILAPFAYAHDDRLRRVGEGGRISLAGRTLRLPKAFQGKIIALRPTETDGLFEVVFRHQVIAALDLRANIRDAQPVTHVPEHPSPISPV
jgi:transposase InsO family protein